MIAVTGASGYIGRAVVVELYRRGLATAAVSRNTSPQTLAGVEWRVANPSSPSKDNFAGCDTVIHLAGRAHTTVASANGRDLFDLENRELALGTAKVAYSAGVRRFVFVSTIGVHGIGATMPLHANSHVRPELPYARSKWAAEQQLAVWCAENEMELCIVRPPMVYGPGSPGSFHRLVRLVRSGIPLPFSLLHAQRSFIYIENLASFLAECGTKNITGIYPVSDGSDWSVFQLVRAIGTALQLPVRCFPMPVALLQLGGRLIGKQRELDSLTLPMYIDPQPAMRDFGWLPQFTPEDALRLSLHGYAI